MVLFFLLNLPWANKVATFGDKRRPDPWWYCQSGKTGEPWIIMSSSTILFRHVPTFANIYCHINYPWFKFIYCPLPSITIVCILVLPLVPSTLETHLDMISLNSGKQKNTMQKLACATFGMNAPILKDKTKFSPMPLANMRSIIKIKGPDNPTCQQCLWTTNCGICQRNRTKNKPQRGITKGVSAGMRQKG